MKNKFFALFTILLSISLITTYSCKKEKVKSVSVTEVGLNKTSTTLIEGETESLVATVMPENATDKSVVWESGNESAATVSQEGLVTAVGEGKATITVKTNDGGFSASCEVTVNKKVIAVTGVVLGNTELTLVEGEEEKLAAAVTPENATDKSVVWESSNKSAAAVSQEGLVTAVGEGKATITVKTNDGGFSASCEVTVNKKVIAVTGVVLGNTELTLVEGEEEKLAAAVTPENATDKSVVWESSNKSAAAVSQEGLVTAVGEGKATITVKTNDGGFSASCEVTVNKKVIAVTGVKLSAASMTLREGEKGTLTATVEPANATNKNVEWWTSDLDVVSVISTSGSSNGYVEARKAGTATVTVKTEDGEFSASCEITVEKKEVPVTGISIEPSSLKLPVGDTYSLILHVQPSDATNQDIKWLSTNESVATVNAEGKVTAVAAGSAEIRAMLEGKFANCPVEVDDVKMTMKKTSYMVILSLSKKINIESDIETNFTMDKSKITVVSADPLIATVDQDLNLVAPGKTGKARITLNYRYGNGLLSTSFMVTVKKNLKD